MALSGPGTRPAWVEVRVADQAPSLEFLAKLGQSLARLMVGQVFSEDRVSVRVMRTQPRLRREPEHSQGCMPQAGVQLAQLGPCYYLLLNKNMREGGTWGWPGHSL